MNYKDIVNGIKSGTIKPENEEQTKNWIIMPILSELGYDFTSTNVIPEYTADFGNKNGERVDYLLKRENGDSIIVECKASNVKLDTIHIRQLSVYYHNLTGNKNKPSIAVLTNGLDWWMFTDTEVSNIMDSQPFIKVNLLNNSEDCMDKLYKYKYADDNYTDDNTLRKALSDLIESLNKIDSTSQANVVFAIDRLTELCKCRTDEIIGYYINKITICQDFIYESAMDSNYLEGLKEINKYIHSSINIMIRYLKNKSQQIQEVSINNISATVDINGEEKKININTLKEISHTFEEKYRCNYSSELSKVQDAIEKSIKELELIIPLGSPKEYVRQRIKDIQHIFGYVISEIKDFEENINI